MSLGLSALQILNEHALPASVRRDSVLSLGVPELNVSSASVNSLLGVSLESVNFNSLMQGLGYSEIATLDLSDYQGCSYVADLNLPLSGIEKQFDLIIDCGTIEHCFNVGQAFFNAKKLCAVGGVIFHNNPANWVGHGFWNFSPCAYFDFYNANGFEVKVFLRDVQNSKWWPVEYKPLVTKILKQRRYIIHAVAKKIEEVPDRMPVQRRYEILHERANNAS